MQEKKHEQGKPLWQLMQILCAQYAPAQLCKPECRDRQQKFEGLFVSASVDQDVGTKMRRAGSHGFLGTTCIPTLRDSVMFDHKLC